MHDLAGLLFAAALLLGAAGLAKVLTPDATRVALRTAGLPSARWAPRLIGVAELAIAVFALAVGGRVAAGLVVLAYLGFAGFSAVLLKRSRGGVSCGCFGGDDSPVTGVHVVLNVVIAAAAAGSAVWPNDGLWSTASDTPWAGVGFVALVILLAWVAQVAFTALPAVQSAVQAPPPRRPRSSQIGSVPTPPEISS